MPKERNALKAGIFIIASIALIFATIVGIKGVGRVTDPTDIRIVRFKLTDNIGGLRVGDDVRVGGLRVGVVKDIGLDLAADGANSILVQFSFPRRIPLHANAHLAIEAPLTGPANLNFDDLGNGDLLAAGAALTGSPAALASFLASAKDVGPSITSLMKDVRTVTVPKVNTALDKTTETVTTFKSTATNATELLQMLKERLPTIIVRARDTLTHVREIFGESKGDIKGTLANLNASTGSLKEKLPGILDKVDLALQKAQTTIDGVNMALEDIKKVAANTRDITVSGKSILVTNRSKIDSMIASLKITGDNLKAGSAEVRHAPWRLLYKPGPGEVANLNLYDTARQFADGANGLSDAANALRDALKNPEVQQSDVQRLVDKLDDSFKNFTTVEDQLWKQVKQ